MGLDELDSSEWAGGGEGCERVEVVDRQDVVAQLVELFRNFCIEIDQLGQSQRAVEPYSPCLCASS